MRKESMVRMEKGKLSQSEHLCSSLDRENLNKNRPPKQKQSLGKIMNRQD